MSPQIPPTPLCFLWSHRKSCKCAHVNCTGARCWCPSGMWSVWLRAEEDSALQNRLLCQWLCSWQRSSDQRFFFSPSEALRKNVIITLEGFLAKWSNDAFTISAQKFGLNSLISLLNCCTIYVLCSVLPWPCNSAGLLSSLISRSQILKSSNLKCFQELLALCNQSAPV